MLDPTVLVADAQTSHRNLPFHQLALTLALVGRGGGNPKLLKFLHFVLRIEIHFLDFARIQNEPNTVDRHWGGGGGVDMEERRG